MQTNYKYDRSQATISCKVVKDAPVVSPEQLGKVYKQYVLNIAEVKAQVIEIITKTGKDCTVIQPNYLYDPTNSSMSCN